MKTIFICLFYSLFIIPVFADIRSNFEFEGMRIGDSLLTHMTEEEILNEIEYNSNIGENYLNDKFGEVYFDVTNSENKTTHLAFYVNPNDQDFLIHFIRKIIIFENDFESCMSARNKLDKSIQGLYDNIDREEISFKMDFDLSGESESHNINYLFINGDFVTLSCQKYSEIYKENYNFVDQLNFAIGTKQIKEWFMNPIVFSSSVFAENIGGTAWILNDSDGDKRIILFEKDNTFTYQNLKSSSGNEGSVFSDSNDTWYKEGDLIVISFNDGYRLVSLKIDQNKMSGSAINKEGVTDIVEGYKID